MRSCRAPPPKICNTRPETIQSFPGKVLTVLLHLPRLGYLKGFAVNCEKRCSDQPFPDIRNGRDRTRQLINPEDSVMGCVFLPKCRQLVSELILPAVVLEGSPGVDPGNQGIEP